ncbi:MAG: hypothetical protein LQ345_001297 [Seirophora villosa]|nr:MAG: hypothetical protein LQ345_001297 [Seirophora villosa]
MPSPHDHPEDGGTCLGNTRDGTRLKTEEQWKPKPAQASSNINGMMSQLKDFVLVDTSTAPGKDRSREQEDETRPRKKTNAKDYQVHVPLGTRKPVPSHVMIPLAAVQEFEEAVFRMVKLLQMFRECRDGSDLPS